MLGKIIKGESLIFAFDSRWVNFNGKYDTTVLVPSGRITKDQLIRLQAHGVINNWGVFFDKYSVDVNTGDIEWED